MYSDPFHSFLPLFSLHNPKSFQLIVITHDDEFVTRLGKSEAISKLGGTPFFLRVSRDLAEDGRCYSNVVREEWEKQ
jgi:hypothetical protein